MPIAKTVDRFTWAVETLDIQPADQVLEIGCGHGLAIAPICEKLKRGRLVAIDRSTTMIAAAQKRNRALAETGKARFEATTLADADLGRQRFSKIFAINVNLFWLDPAKELALIARLLKPGGALYLFFQPPTAEQAKRIIVTLKERLAGHGFREQRISFAPPALFCVIAAPA